MDFTISDIFPSASHGLKNIGFFFGAGTSKKAGYPLMPSLTKSVLQSIQPDDQDILDKLIFNPNTSIIREYPPLPTSLLAV